MKKETVVKIGLTYMICCTILFTTLYVLAMTNPDHQSGIDINTFGEAKWEWTLILAGTIFSIPTIINASKSDDKCEAGS